MCAVVQNLTHDFGRLVALVKSCNGMWAQLSFVSYSNIQHFLARLQQAIARPSTLVMNPQEVRALSILIFIVALLGEHCDFDLLRVENNSNPTFCPLETGPLTYFLIFIALAADLDAIAKVRCGLDLNS